MSFVDEITKLQITNERNKVNKVHTRLIEVLKERNILQTELFDTKRDYAGLQNKYSEIENELFKIKDSANTYRELSEQIKTLECEKDVRDKTISQLKEEIAELKSDYEEQIFDLKTELKSESASKERALESAEYYKKLKHKKPVIGFVAGDAVPFGHKMGYAGDVITNGSITVQDKRDAMASAGMTVVDSINSIHDELAKLGLAKA